MSETFEDFKNTYPVIIEFPIHWGDMDAFQHVNNVMYFRYFESARIAYMAETNIMSELKTKQIGPILASTECRYRRPVTFPDTLHVGCRTLELGESDYTQEYAIYSSSQDTITTIGKARIVMVDYKTGNRIEVSDSIRAAIRNKENKDI